MPYYKLVERFFIEIKHNNFCSYIYQGQGTAQKWISNISSHQIHYRLDNEFIIIFIVC